MPLRRRISFVAATAVAVAVLVCALVGYLVVRGELRGQVNDALKAQAIAVQHGDVHALAHPLPGIPPSAGPLSTFRSSQRTAPSKPRVA